MFAKQKVLDDAADTLELAGGAPVTSGFAGVSIDVANNSIALYWRGSLPGAVRTAVARSQRGGISTTVHSAKHTRYELVAEAERQVRQGPALQSGLRVVSAAPQVDGNGVTVGVDTDSTRMPLSDEMKRSMAAELTRQIAVTVVPDVSPAPALRANDSSPFWGGALAQVRDHQGNISGYCTTGFGVVSNTVPKQRHLLTAAHCGGTSWQTYFGTQMGPVGARDWAHDSMLVNAATADDIYEGPWHGAPPSQADVYRRIASASTNRVGDLLCTSGSYSGTICGAKIVLTGVTIDVGGGLIFTNMVQAEDINHSQGVGNGDSGGPAYVPSGQPFQGFARGIISAIDTSASVPCQGEPAVPGGRTCAWRMYFTDVMTNLRSLNVHFSGQGPV